MAVTPDGKTVYAANQESNSVTPIEVATNTAGSEVKVGIRPFAIAVTPNGKTVYVTNETSGSVTPIEVATNTPGAEIRVGSHPEGVAISPDGTTAYVTNEESKSVTPITVESDTPGSEIKVGSEPVGIAVTPPPAPAVVTGAASEVTQTTATLNATVNPEGGTPSACTFEYGATESYGQSAPCASLPATGTSAVGVTAALSGLDANTTYHYRISATNNDGPGSDGADAAFTTPANPPAVVTEGASAITNSSATLNATVNPEGVEVTAAGCKFEYGTSEAYGSSVNCESAPGSGTSPVSVTAQLAALKPGTAYYYRISVTNNSGTSKGLGESFETLAVAPSFSIEKLQKIEGEAGFTELPLGGKDGQTVDYEIVVKNTGNVTLEFKALSDTGCTGISPSTGESVAAGAEQTYTCHHVLAGAGIYSNEASIEGSEGAGKKTSNKVVVNIASEPSFSIEKLQKVEGEVSYTESELSGKVGKAVDYEIIVHDTGNTSLKFGALQDGGCENVSGGATELASGGSATFTCTHKLTSAGPYRNQAAIEGSEGTGTETSNTVTVNVPREGGFTIEKEQRLSAQGAFTKGVVTGEPGQTVDYEIIVHVGGDVPLRLSRFTDTHCTNLTGGPPGEVQPGESVTWTCEQVLAALGEYTNEASVEADEGVGIESSNEVVALATPPLPELGRCTKLHRPSGKYTTAACTTASNSEDSGSYEWEPWPVRNDRFHFTSGAAMFETVGKTRVTCAANTLAGQYTGAQTATMSLDLTACEAPGVLGGKCQSEGAAAGEIRSGELDGRLGMIKGGKAPIVGWDLEGTAGHDLMSFKCGGTEIVVTGSAIAPVTRVDHMAPTFVLRFRAKRGEQDPEKFENGLSDTLRFVTSSTEEQAGLTMNATMSNEEALEIKAIA